MDMTATFKSVFNSEVVHVRTNPTTVFENVVPVAE